MHFFEALDVYKVGDFSLGSIMSALLIFVVSAVVIRLFRLVMKRAMKKSRLSSGVKGYITSAAVIALWVVAAVITADTLGVPTASLVAIISVVGVALSLSIQGTLENVFSGMTLLAAHPFTENDYVDIGGTSGTVISIGLFYTVITTNDQKSIYIPNSTVTGAKITNYSSLETRRIDLFISASYGDSTEKVKAALLDAALKTEGVLREPAPFVGISSYDDSSIKYSLFVWTPTDKYLPVKFALTEKLRDSFDEHGVTMTYSHLNVHIVEK